MSITPVCAGLVRMDEQQERAIGCVLEKRVGGSFDKIQLMCRRGSNPAAIFPRATFFICEVSQDFWSEDPHRAVGVLWVAGSEDAGGACAIIYLGRKGRGRGYQAKVLRYLRTTYGLCEVPRVR